MSNFEVMKKTDLPTKGEKLSEMIQVAIPPSLKKMIDEAKSHLNLDFPVFARDVLKKELEKLPKNLGLG